MAIRARAFTAEELFRMPDDGMRHELVEGRLTTMVPAGPRHGRVALDLGARLLGHVKETGAGAAYGAETGFKLRSDPDTVRAPDVAFVARERAAAEPATGYFPGPPDLAAEVISPSDSFTEVQAKALDWLAAGVRLVLVVDPARETITVYRGEHDVHVLTAEETLDAGDVVPGWRVPVRSLFG